jgi:hypothetical protein
VANNVRHTGAVAHQPACLDKHTADIRRRNAVARSEDCELGTPALEIPVTPYQERRRRIELSDK